MQQQIAYYSNKELMNDEININVKKIIFILLSKKTLLIKTFIVILLIFIALTYVLPKKYKVESDLYINKTNNTNISEVNPYIIDEVSGSIVSMGIDKALNNELELMQSPLVIDKVIRENNLVYKKNYGILPNKKEGEFITTKSFLKKNIKFEVKKNTNVITITYKSKDNEKAYNVVNSIIKNYIALHKELNSYKSKSDKKIIESEYNRVKADLNKKVNYASGLPSNAISGAGNLAALSAFSTSAQKAMGTLQGQYIAGEKSRVEISEDAAKVANLSQKLEWAKLVEDMSDTSKVLILKEPNKPRDFEYSSPKLLINIILGIVFGLIGALMALIISETTDKKLNYSCLGDEVIYNIEKDFFDLQVYLLANSHKKICFVMFDNISPDIIGKLNEYKNIKFVKADLNQNFVNDIENSQDVVLIAKIGVTEANLFKQIKSVLIQLNKNIAKEVLV